MKKEESKVVSAKADTGLKESGWFAQCKKITMAIEEGHQIARQIIGPRPDVCGTEPVEVFADRLDTELAALLSNAEDLVDQLKLIVQKF